MKTAISISDELFNQAEQWARRNRKSRSELYSEALREYLARHAPDAVTEAMNRVVDEVGRGNDEFVEAASRRILANVEW